MTWTAPIYRWNSLSWQYKSENPVGNPLFPQRRLSESGDLRDEFIGENRLVKLGLGRIGFQETAGARQQKIERRDAFSNVETSATGGQKQEREQGRARHTFAGEIHLVASMSWKTGLAIFKEHIQSCCGHSVGGRRNDCFSFWQNFGSHTGYKPALSIKFRHRPKILASTGYNRFANARIDYIVQPAMKMVKLNAMRTFRRDVFQILGGVRCSTAVKFSTILVREGLPTIDRRFNAGIETVPKHVSKRRLKWESQSSVRDSARAPFDPTLKRRVIFSNSLGTRRRKTWIAGFIPRVFSYFNNSRNEFRAPVQGICALVSFLCLLMLFAHRASATYTNTTRGYLELEYQKWSKQFHTNTSSAEAAWNFGRACFDMSTLQKDTAEEAKYAQEGIDATRAAVTLAPNSAPAHYYLGMDMGQLADTKRNLSAFRMVKDMEREFSAARALDKHFDYAGPSRNLGLLYRDAPTIISIGSRSKARQFLEESVELAPEFPENQLNLIESYLKWDYKTEALRQFGDLEKIWPQAQKKLTGVAWDASWTDWNKRLDAIRKKLEKNPKNESPHSQ